jgi:hypothetical protein
VDGLVVVQAERELVVVVLPAERAGVLVRAFDGVPAGGEDAAVGGVVADGEAGAGEGVVALGGDDLGGAVEGVVDVVDEDVLAAGGDAGGELVREAVAEGQGAAGAGLVPVLALAGGTSTAPPT